MVQCKNIGVFLTDAMSDDSVIATAAKLGRVMGGEKIHFVHIGATRNIVGGAALTQEAFRDDVNVRFGKVAGIECSYEVDQKTGIAEILSKTTQLDLDLIIIGRELPHGMLEVGGRLVRIARKAPCSVMIVPPGATPHAERVLVATDFSAHARSGLLQAIDMLSAGGSPKAQILCVHAFDVPYGHQYTGGSLHEIVSTLETNRRREFDTFMKDIDTKGVSVESMIVATHDAPAVVVEIAAIRKMDVIVVGSRGRSTTATAMIGQFSERMAISSTTPLLIHKTKGETLKLLDALRNLL